MHISWVSLKSSRVEIDKDLPMGSPCSGHVWGVPHSRRPSELHNMCTQVIAQPVYQMLPTLTQAYGRDSRGLQSHHKCSTIIINSDAPTRLNNTSLVNGQICATHPGSRAHTPLAVIPQSKIKLSYLFSLTSNNLGIYSLLAPGPSLCTLICVINSE